MDDGYRWISRRWLGGAVVLVSLALSGCGGSPASGFNAVIGEAAQELAQEFDEDFVLGFPGVTFIRVINQTGMDLTLELSIDDTPFVISCTAASGVCDQTLAECPEEIEAVEQTLTDDRGGFGGGRLFDRKEEFNFIRGVNFTCGQFVTYQFTEGTAAAFAL